METVNITIRMDKTLKKQSEELFKDLGLTMSAAFNMFAKQAVREQRIPFDVTRKPAISFAEKNTLDQVADDELRLHLKAYKELAK